MLRIGEVAKQFNISNRTLRYWEEMGILNSSRTENNYRFYDSQNAARIKYIVLLRKLKMPIADIEQIFIIADHNVAIDALSRHLKNLKHEAAFNSLLVALIELLVQRISGPGSLEQVFFHLEQHTAAIDSAEKSMPQNLSSERIMIMSAKKLENVRFVRLPAMTIASYRAESDNPEMDCFKVTNKFIFENNLHKWAGFRHFGFNNPNPSENNPIYGYEHRIAIPEDLDVPAPLTKMHIDSALYASIPTSMSEIGDRFQQLYEWLQSNDEYEADVNFRWLEECIDFETFIAAFENPAIHQQLDILAPVKRKNY